MKKALVWAGGWFVAGAALAGACGDTYHVQGRITDGSGRGVGDAAVYMLVDKVSKKKTEKQGIRAVGTRTDGSGGFSHTVTCGGSPNPCAKNPKHVTIMVDQRGLRATLKTFRLADVEVVKLGGECVVRVPPIAVKQSF